MIAENILLRLPERCVTVAAGDLRDQFLKVTDQDEIQVDASAVELIGQAVLQVLVAAARAAEASGGSFAIINPSPAFAERVSACRLGEAIGLPVEGETIP